MHLYFGPIITQVYRFRENCKEIREKNKSCSILASIRSDVTSSRSEGEALLAKLCSSQHYQYLRLVVIGLIKIRYAVYSNYIRCVFSTHRKCWAFGRIYGFVLALHHIPIYVQIAQYISFLACSNSDENVLVTHWWDYWFSKHYYDRNRKYKDSVYEKC